MPPRYDEAPELAPHNFPEVHHPPSVPEVATYSQLPSPPTPIKPEELTNSSTLHTGYATLENQTPPSYTYNHQSGYGPIPPSEHGRAPRRILGCSVLVFVLSIIIATLSAAVIGLAAGTGVEASRANDAEARLASMSASGGPPATVTVTAPMSNPTVDKGCSANSDGVTGTHYNSAYFEQSSFTIYCNSDAPNAPLLSMFVSNFDDCIDACAFYSHYMPSDFSSNSTTTPKNVTCSAVSYIPVWTNRTFALQGNAPGNCYLKPGPQNQSALNEPNIGGYPVHAAILDS
ncbi:hypothetical protein GGS26DRAFT_264939 [Hypomontagnella submonticulosa]|nr:hypothetical protein GGS26DRAFT_264939 [Hypomontagnella submonticulosa]